jgi:hypothetical protein
MTLGTCKMFGLSVSHPNTPARLTLSADFAMLKAAVVTLVRGGFRAICALFEASGEAVLVSPRCA